MKFLTASRLWNGVGFVENPVIGIEDGRIHSISTVMAGQLPNQSSDENLDFPGATLAPAFFDVHIHGSAGHDVMEATSEALSAIGQFLASHGTGSYLATTVTAPLDETLRALEGLAKLIDNPQAIESASVGRPTSVPIGIHLEGPFLSHVRRGVHPEKLLLEPDTHVFDQLYDASGGHAVFAFQWATRTRTEPRLMRPSRQEPSAPRIPLMPCVPSTIATPASSIRC
jgi:N-acetylglucosamine-6-phosphate deacetylase